jgi:hypothetical protein
MQKFSFYDSIYAQDDKIICLTEMQLSNSFWNDKLFADVHSVYCADRVYSNFDFSQWHCSYCSSSVCCWIQT